MLCGIFVGGRSRRMEGFPKALLRTPDGETLVTRTIRIVTEAGLEPVLVGDASALRVETACRAIADAEGDGPLAGVAALLHEEKIVIALACDMPRITTADLVRLANEPSSSAIVAPRRDDFWEPLFARYDARARLVAARRLVEGKLALQGLIDEVGAQIFPIDLSTLEDVDTPDDARRANLHGAP